MEPNTHSLPCLTEARNSHHGGRPTRRRLREALRRHANPAAGAFGRDERTAALRAFFAGCHQEPEARADADELHRALTFFMARRGLAPYSSLELATLLRRARFRREGPAWQGVGLPAPAPTPGELAEAVGEVPCPVRAVTADLPRGEVALLTSAGTVFVLRFATSHGARQAAHALDAIRGSLCVLSGVLVAFGGRAVNK